jgi:hypothetical protein
MRVVIAPLEEQPVLVPYSQLLEAALQQEVEVDQTLQLLQQALEHQVQMGV